MKKEIINCQEKNLDRVISFMYDSKGDCDE